jgi:hypothetical protein
MQLMLVAAGAILLPLDALRVETLVLHGEVVAILTLAAGEDDLLSRHFELPVIESVRVGVVSVGGSGSLGCLVRVPTPVRRAGCELLKDWRTE